MNQIIAKGGPVMYPILLCSIIAVAVIMERLFFWIAFSRKKRRDVSPEEMRRFLPILDTMVTVTPLLGILGTATGIIRCFNLLGSGVRDVLAISGGIAEALITTSAGLIVAIMSLVFYNYFALRYEKALSQIPRTENGGGENE